MELSVLRNETVSSSGHIDGSLSSAPVESHSKTFTNVADELGHKLLLEWQKPAVKLTAEVIAPLALAALALEKSCPTWFFVSNEIKTADPLRSLIRIEGYGGRRTKALAMEKIVASARNHIADQSLTTGSDVEQFIADRYMTKLHKWRGGSLQRGYNEAFPHRKHRAYDARFDQLLADSSDYIATTNIDGKNWNLMKTQKSTFWEETIKETIKHNYRWLFPRSEALKQSVNGRVNQLFSEVMATRSMPQSTEALSANISRVAEMEWLNANLWKYQRGGAGVSQLESRTWLEAAGIDSGRYKQSVDPNLEALIRPLDDFKTAYPSFYEKPPNYFKRPSRETSLIPRFEPQPSSGRTAA